MEQEKKNCPYCGEEIMATAKKCKHCGEWLAGIPVITEQTGCLSNQKESHYPNEYLFDRTKMNILFWVTVVGAFLSYNNQLPEQFWILSMIGSIFLSVGKICFLFILMRVMSYMSKPLKIYYIIPLFLYIFYSISGIVDGISFYVANGLNSTIRMIIILSGFVNLFFMMVLGYHIIRNYSDAIKLTGWIIVIYSIVTFIRIVISYEIDYSLVMFAISFILDFLYLGFMRNVLSKKVK